MTIQEVVSSLQFEKQKEVPSRFPCRAILVKTIAQYCELLSELKKISDIRVVRSGELFSSADVMPKYENLTDAKYQNEWIILTGVSEYLRLFSRSEVTTRRFASLWSSQKAATSKGRIIIPLWGCESQWFDKALNLTTDVRQEEFFYNCVASDEEEQRMNLLVLSGAFEAHLDKFRSVQGIVKIGMQEWFEYWQNPSSAVNEYVLLTKRCNSIASSTGTISIRVMKDLLAFIRDRMPSAQNLTNENCSEAMQKELFEYACNGDTLDHALLHSLNVSTFNGIDIMSKWEAMPMSHKQFVALWFSLHPDNTYLSYCFNRSKGIGHILETIGREIFNVRIAHPEWVEEFKRLSMVTRIKADNEYIQQLDQIPEYDVRLDFMISSSREMHVYLLRMVGKWLREDPAQVFGSAKLKNVFPELHAYLCHYVSALDSDLRCYLNKYRSFKLENTLPNDEESYFAGFETGQYDSRYSILSDKIDHDTVVLWVDALGIEWAQLLMWSLENNCDATVRSVHAVQAILPTETCYNAQWDQMDVAHCKLDKLDKLAHKGVIDEPDYYSCIDEQIAFITNIHHRVSELLEAHHRVIITGDHGTSRLAARFFHTRDGFNAPVGAKICSHGRYCVLNSGSLLAIPGTEVVSHPDGKRYAVFSGYDHFKQSGFAAGVDDDNAIYGEVHGGATPEEMLVPVIVLDSNHECPLTAQWDNPDVKIRMKKAKLIVKFSKPVQQVSAVINGIHGEAVPLDVPTKWAITFAGVKPAKYMLQICADNQMVSMPELTIQSALGGGEGDLP